MQSPAAYPTIHLHNPAVVQLGGSAFMHECTGAGTQLLTQLRLGP